MQLKTIRTITTNKKKLYVPFYSFSYKLALPTKLCLIVRNCVATKYVYGSSSKYIDVCNQFWTFSYNILSTSAFEIKEKKFEKHIVEPQMRISPKINIFFQVESQMAMCPIFHSFCFCTVKQLIVLSMNEK